MFFDTHTHLYVPDFANSEVEVEKAIEAGVGKLVFPNIDASSVEPMLGLCKKYPGTAYPALGLHPTELGTNYMATIDMMAQMLKAPDNPYVGVGEIGIDLYWDKSQVNEQKEAFTRQIEIARSLDLPVIIHCRKALNEILALVKDDVKMIFHCFSGNPEEVKMIRRRVPEAYFGIGGVVTFKNSGLKATLPEIGLNKIVLETDSPYLAPVPHRGKQNTSAYIPLIAAKVAEFMNVPLAEVEQRTTQNALEIFDKIKP